MLRNSVAPHPIQKVYRGIICCVQQPGSNFSILSRCPIAEARSTHIPDERSTPGKIIKLRVSIQGIANLYEGTEDVEE